MNTIEFDNFASEIDAALSRGKKLRDEELNYYAHPHNIPQDLQDEIQLRVNLSYAHQKKIITYFINELRDKKTIKGVNTVDLPTGGRGGGNSSVPPLEASIQKHEVIKTEIEQQYPTSYKAELNDLTGDKRKQKAIDYLNRQFFDFRGFTIDDAATNKHIDILKERKKRIQYDVYNSIIRNWQNANHKDTFVKIDAEFKQIIAAVNGTFETQFPKALREFNKNIFDARDNADKAKIIQYYEGELIRQLDGIIQDQVNKNIGLESVSTLMPIKEYYRLLQLNAASNRATALIAQYEKNKSYFFYVFMVNVLHQTIEPIETVKNNLNAASANNIPGTQHKTIPISTNAQLSSRQVALYYTYLILSNVMDHFSKMPGNVRDNIKKMNQENNFVNSENTVYTDFLKVYKDKKERTGDSVTKQTGNKKAIENLESVLRELVKNIANSNALQMAKKELEEAKAP